MEDSKAAAKREQLLDLLNTKLRHLENEIAVGRAENAQTVSVYLNSLREITEKNKKLLKEVAEKKKAKKELELSEEKYRTLVETVTDIIYRIDQHGNFFFLNQAVDQLGYKPEELLGKNFKELVHPEDYEHISRAGALEKFAGRITGDRHAPKLFDERRTGNRITRNLEVRLVTKTKEVRDVSINYVLVEVNSAGQYSSKGKFLGSIGVIRDVTERKKAEEALQESEERFRTLAELLPEIVLELDERGLISYLNRRYYDVSGYSRDEIKEGAEAAEMFVASQRRQVRKNILEQINGGEAWIHEFEVARKDGGSFPAIARFTPVYKYGRIAGMRGIIFDLTERKQLEEEQSKGSKLESIGILAGGIAHDFNNILTAILGNITLGKICAGKNAELNRFLSEAEDASLRARSLTQQLLTFSRGITTDIKPASIAILLKTAVPFALRGSNVTPVLHLPEDLWLAEFDEDQISQVINNLVINAVQSMPEGGTVTVSAENVTLKASGRLPLEEGKYVKFSIRDKGLGIPKENLNKIFDPYFSTKEHGSGLGLATAYSVIKRHGGYIAVNSTPGAGSEFQIYLPATFEKAPERAVETPEDLEHRAKILVMDDDKMVRDVARRMLEQIGCVVEVAGDGAEALKIYKKARSSGNPFDLVVMDLTVPGGMGGKEALQKMLKFDPRARAIVSSGYSQDQVLSNYEKYGFKGLISKPYKLEELRNVIHRVLKRK